MQSSLEKRGMHNLEGGAWPPFVRGLSEMLRGLVLRLRPTAQSSDSFLAIEQRLSIGPKKALMLVNCNGRRFLLATAGDMVAPMIEVQPLAAGDLRVDLSAGTVQEKVGL